MNPILVQYRQLLLHYTRSDLINQCRYLGLRGMSPNNKQTILTKMLAVNQELITQRVRLLLKNQKKQQNIATTRKVILPILNQECRDILEQFNRINISFVSGLLQKHKLHQKSQIQKLNPIQNSLADESSKLQTKTQKDNKKMHQKLVYQPDSLHQVFNARDQIFFDPRIIASQYQLPRKQIVEKYFPSLSQIQLNKLKKQYSVKRYDDRPVTTEDILVSFAIKKQQDFYAKFQDPFDTLLAFPGQIDKVSKSIVFLMNTLQQRKDFYKMQINSYSLQKINHIVQNIKSGFSIMNLAKNKQAQLLLKIAQITKSHQILFDQKNQQKHKTYSWMLEAMYSFRQILAKRLFESKIIQLLKNISIFHKLRQDFLIFLNRIEKQGTQQIFLSQLSKQKYSTQFEKIISVLQQQWCPFGLIQQLAQFVPQLKLESVQKIQNLDELKCDAMLIQLSNSTGQQLTQNSIDKILKNLNILAQISLKSQLQFKNQQFGVFLSLRQTVFSASVCNSLIKFLFKNEKSQESLQNLFKLLSLNFQQKFESIDYHKTLQTLLLLEVLQKYNVLRQIVSIKEQQITKLLIKCIKFINNNKQGQALKNFGVNELITKSIYPFLQKHNLSKLQEVLGQKLMI